MKTACLRTSLIACASALAACGGSPAETASAEDGVAPLELHQIEPNEPRSAGPTAVPLEDFCHALTVALCDPLEACECGEQRSLCKLGVAEECAGPGGIAGPEVRGAVESGRMRYDARRAARVLAELAEGARACENAFTARRWTHGDMMDFAGVLTGQVANGRKCSLPFRPFGPNECGEGFCMHGPEGLRCVGYTKPGAACGERVCWRPNAALEVEDLVTARLFGPCLERDGRTVCSHPLPVEEPCAIDAECASGRCVEQTCQPKLEIGQRCDFPFDCETGFCDFESRRCAVRKLEVGQRCERDAHCQSEVCYDDRCAPPICRR